MNNTLPPPPPTSSIIDPGFPKWEIAVIVIGVLVGLTAIAAIVYCTCITKGKKSDVNVHPEPGIHTVHRVELSGKSIRRSA